MGRGWVFDLCPDGWVFAFWKTWRRFRHRLTQFRPRAGPISAPFGPGSATFGFLFRPPRDSIWYVYEGQQGFSKVGVLCGRGGQDLQKWSFRVDETNAGDFRPRLKSAGQKKTSFRADETQYFLDSTIRSRLPRTLRGALHKLRG